MFHQILKTSAAAAVISMMATSAFAAVDGQNVVALLTKQLEGSGAYLEVGSVEVKGDDDVVLTNIKLGSSADNTFDIDSFLLQDVAGNPSEGYVIGRMALPEFSKTEKGTSIAFGGAAIDNYFVAGPEVNDPLLKGSIYEKMTIGPIAIGSGGDAIFTMAGAQATMSPYTPGGTLDFTMDVKDILVNIAASTDQKFKTTMKELGYEQIKGQIVSTGSWDTTSGVMLMDKMTFATEDAADLNMTMKIGGYTPQLVGALQEMQKSMKGNEQAMGLAMLGLMQQLDVRGLSISVDDNSLTGRLLDYFGGKQGMNRESTVAFAKGMLPIGLSQLGNPEFAAKASAAIGQYLSDPKNIKVSSKPENPVPVAQLIAAGSGGNPGSIIDILDVKIEANQ